MMPLLAHAVETWNTTNIDERRPSMFKKKILCRIYGPICKRQQWRTRYNSEFEELYSELNIGNVIKSSRLR
jgi:hypothetical protein